MSLTLYTTIKTPPIHSMPTILDTGLAASQGALVSTVLNVLTPRHSAILGAVIRLAAKVNETILNSIFQKIREAAGDNIVISIMRKVADIGTSAALATLAMHLFAPVSFSTALFFAALENIRPIHVGGAHYAGAFLLKGIELKV